MTKHCVAKVRTPPPEWLWMRAVSFAGLHRILNAVGSVPNGLRAKDINNLVLEQRIVLTHRVPRPKPTTLYHYRNTLLRLRALERRGQRLYANVSNSDVRALLRQPAPASDEKALADAARQHFAALVLSNSHCNALFFDLFVPPEKNAGSVSDFREHGDSVSWRRQMPTGDAEIVFENERTGRTIRHQSQSVPAILYGLRYWARDELNLIDEYSHRSDHTATMFPIHNPPSSPREHASAVQRAVHFLLCKRTSDEWTLFSVSGLIGDYCQIYRQPRVVLFDAIEWLNREWPDHTFLIPTSLGLATLTATSPQQRDFILRRYYKIPHGPYISHIRLHKDIPHNPTNMTDQHA